MNEHDLHDALQYLDDDLIEDVESLRGRKRGVRHIRAISRIAAAACVCLVIGAGAVIVAQNHRHDSAPLSDIADTATKAPDYLADDEYTDGKSEVGETTPDDLRDFEYGTPDTSMVIVDGTADYADGSTQNGGSDCQGSPAELPTFPVTITDWHGDDRFFAVINAGDNDTLSEGSEIEVILPDKDLFVAEDVYYYTSEEDGDAPLVLFSIDKNNLKERFPRGSEVTLYGKLNDDGTVSCLYIAE